MGRHYTGDINGHFMFGVQASDDASHFGGEEMKPEFLEYYFEENDIEDIEEGISDCKKELGDNEAKLRAFFLNNSTYNDETVAKELNLTYSKDDHKYNNAVYNVLEQYARLLLGEKILACVKENSECHFTAEL